MRFGVLGEVVAYNERGQVPLGSARQRTVLAALLVEPGGFVALDQLVDRVWGQTPPQQARQTLHTYLSRLRSVLGDAGGPAPARRSAGYTLEVDTSAVDLHRFRHLVAQAGQAADDRAAGLWREAMALWRGRPFADLDSDWLRAVAVGLEAERLAAMLDHTDLLLRRGEHARLLPELTAAAGEHPLDERLAGQLMLALYRCGRQADALAHYRLLHDRLADELGSATPAHRPAGRGGTGGGGIARFREAHDRLGEAFGLANLGVVTEGLGRHDEAADHNRRALAIFRELGSLYHEGLTLGNLADVEVLQGEYTMAAEHLREALGIVQRLDIPITEASVLDSLGRLHLRLGQPDTATGYLRRAFDLCRATGEKYGQTLTLNGLGQAAQDAGRPTEALAHHTDALALALETSTRHEQARAHAGIGHARHALGEPAAARENYQAAYAIYTELDLPEAAGDLRTRLDSLIQRETGSR